MREVRITPLFYAALAAFVLTATTNACASLFALDEVTYASPEGGSADGGAGGRLLCEGAFLCDDFDDAGPVVGGWTRVQEHGSLDTDPYNFRSPPRSLKATVNSDPFATAYLYKELPPGAADFTCDFDLFLAADAGPKVKTDLFLINEPSYELSLRVVPPNLVLAGGFSNGVTAYKTTPAAFGAWDHVSITLSATELSFVLSANDGGTSFSLPKPVPNITAINLGAGVNDVPPPEPWSAWFDNVVCKTR
jgi:hypothetical protein